MRASFRKFFDYFRSPTDVYLFLSAPVWAARVSRMMKRYGLEELLERISQSVDGAPGFARQDYRSRRIVVYVNWWLNRRFLFLQPTCLKRSLILYYILAKRGMNVAIHYGVRRPEGTGGERAAALSAGNHGNGKGLEGHSWLTVEGKRFLMDSMTAGLYKQTFAYPVDGGN